MAQRNKYLCSIYFVLDITSNEGSRWEDVHMLQCKSHPMLNKEVQQWQILGIYHGYGCGGVHKRNPVGTEE